MNKDYTYFNNKVIGGIKLGSGGYYMQAISRLRAKLDKDCRDVKITELMNRINLDSSMVVFRDDDLRVDRVLN